MNRMASMQVGAVLASLAMAFAGCSCDQPATCDNSDLTVAFVSPMEGAMVDQTSNVQVSLSRKGAPVNIGTAKLEVRGPGATDFTDKGNGTADGATATFTGVMLAAGENALRATVAEANCNGSAAPKTIVVTAKSTVTPPPVIVSCTFPQDVNGDGTLNAAELPTGTQVSVRVLTTNGAGATFSAPGSNPAMAPIVNDTATIGVPGPTGDGTFSVTGTVTRGTGAPTCSPMIRVARTPPMCMNTTASLVGPNNDANPMSPGFQLALLGTVSTAVDSARFEVEPGSLSATAMIANGMAGGILTIPTTGDVTYSTTLIAVDAVGNECRSQKDVRANFAGPRLTVTSPVNPDGGAVDFAQTPQSITIVSVGLENGRQICVDAQVGAGAPAQVGCGTVSNNSSTFDLNLTADGVTTFTARATDSVGNAGSTTFVANVALEGCVPAFDPALGCPNTYLTSADVTAGQFAFTGSARANCATRPARLFIGASTTPAATAAVAATGALSFAAVAVSAGTFDARIEVDRLGGGTPYSVTCAGIVVDLTAPAITNPSLPTTPPAIINAQQDLQPAVPGAQRVLAYTGAIPPSGVAVACMSQSAGSSGTACPGNPTFFLMNPAAGVGPSPAQSFTFPEGEYQVILVLRRGAGVNTSAPVAVRVDVTAPCVAMNGFTLPQDTIPTGGDQRLNVAELSGGNPQVAVQLAPACADPSGAPSPTLAIREVNGGVAGATRASGTGTTGAQVTLTFTSPVTTVTNLTLFAEATDWVGNRNAPSGVGNPAVRQVGIYPVLPTCSLTSPSPNARLNATAVSGGIFAQAQTSAGGVVGTNGVEFSLARGLGAPTIQTVTPPATGQAIATFPTLDGSATLSARCTDLALNVQSATAVSFQVDATPPQGCAVTAPLAASSTLTNVVTTTVTTTSAEANATVQVVSSLPAPNTPVGVAFPLNGTTASSALTYALGNQNLTVTISDDFGNTCSVNVANVNVTSTTCVFTVSKGFVNGSTWLNKSAQGDTTVQVTSSNCLGQAATLTRASPPGTFNATTDGTNGIASFSITPVDGDAYSIVVGNSVATSVRVDFVDPVVPTGAFTIAGVAPTVGDLRFVAPVGNPRIAGGPLATAGYYPDTNSNSDGAQINLAINNITGGRQGTANGRVEVLVGGAQLPAASNATDVIDADPKTISFGSAPVVFTHPTANTSVSVRVWDQAGNQVSAFTGNVTVDVIPPGDPSPTITNSNRNGTLTLTWTAVGDDGATGGSPLAYQTRWTTRLVAGANALIDQSEFFSTTRTFRDTDSPSTATGRTLRVPPLNEVLVSVRAVDEVDNFSLTSSGAYPAPITRDLSWSLTTISGSASSAFGRTVESADLNGDGINELIVAAPTTATSVGAVHIYNGDGGVIAQNGCNAGCQTLTPFDSATGQFGIDVGTGGSLDETGAELVVSQSRWSANTGRVFVYFNSSNGGALDPTQRIEIRGDAANTFFGESARIIKSIDGDQFDELAISTPTWPANAAVATDRNVGRLYVFRGRPRSAWSALFGTTIALTDADWALNGPSPRNGTGNAYGQARTGIISAGPVEGSAVFSVPMSRQTIGQTQLWRASSFLPIPLAADPTVQLASTIPTTIQGPVGGATASTGFGQSAVGAVNIYDLSAGSPFNDIVISSPINGQVSLYPDLRLGSTNVTFGTPLTLSGTNLFGYALSVADVNDDGALDIVAVEGGGQAPAAYVWVLFQRDAAAYRSNPATNPLFEGPSTSSFWVARLDGPSVALDTSLTVRDVTNDGRVDIAFSNLVVASPEVRIYR
ncbi:MAG: hypothetical protein Q8N26_31725 [Myxococcales bacterium]|nr:hypothetical protein [Myxococcales bacterium]